MIASIERRDKTNKQQRARYAARSEKFREGARAELGMPLDLQPLLTKKKMQSDRKEEINMHSRHMRRRFYGARGKLRAAGVQEC